MTQARSAYYPTAYGSVTAAGAENNSRIAAGASALLTSIADVELRDVAPVLRDGILVSG